LEFGIDRDFDEKKDAEERVKGLIEKLKKINRLMK